MSENKEGALGQIKFGTSLGRFYEVGNKRLRQNLDQVYYVNKNFFAGIYGRGDEKINSLGFIFQKEFVKQEFKGLKWPAENEDN